MNIAIIVLLVLTITPVVLSFVGGYFRNKQLGEFDNKHPRQQAAQLTGAGARAVAAQQNCWEALMVYAAALLAVVVAGVPLAAISTPCTLILVARLLFPFFYLANLDILRSLSFMLGFGSCLYLFYLAI